MRVGRYKTSFFGLNIFQIDFESVLLHKVILQFNEPHISRPRSITNEWRFCSRSEADKKFGAPAEQQATRPCLGFVLLLGF